MPLVDVKGVHINFPFEPYACQLTYMDKVIQCLQKNENGILESPTGTGKTLCLLCASLAWLQDRKAQTELNRQMSISSLMGDNGTLQPHQMQNLAKSLEKSTGTTWGGSDFAVPKIIYASRTHSQLSQAVQELKRTAYNTVKVSVIGSREQLCVHEHVRKETSNTNKVHMCKAKVNARTCFFYNHFDDIKRNSDVRQLIGDVVDIEDMVTYGEKQRVCPYYMARELKSDADIIFMPYNYLLDAKSRKAHGVEIQGNIVIFDEAHNLEKICEDSSSFDLTSADLATALEELSRLADKLFEMAKTEEQSIVEMTDSSAMPDPEFNLEDVLRLKSTFKELEEKIDNIEIPNKDKGVTKPGIYIFELFSKVNIAFETKNFFVDLLDKIISYITSDATGMSFHSKGAGLTKLSDVLKIVFSREVIDGGSVYQHQHALSKSYKVHIQPTQSNFKKKKIDSWATSTSSEKMGKTLSYWCFSPGHSMLDLVAHGIKCVILTSGTLSPLNSFTAEMQIPFPVTLENPHVIEKHQVWIGTLKKGPDGVTLNSNYQTRFNLDYQASLGKALVNFARVVPNGLLVFFPSYPVMEKCLENWQQTGIYNSITQYKQLLVEPRGKQAFTDVSEGLDFADNNGRAVLITGLPYPPRMDPKVVLKMQFLDESRGKLGFNSLSGQEWYKQQASRAVNQAIGRVIRHRQDYGAILLCDTRFSENSALSQLPVWIRPHVNKYDVFGRAIKDVIVFFKTAEQRLPAPQKKSRRADGGVPAGCHGAHFMPTISRSAPPSMAQAKSVAHHVPSLKDDGMSIAKLQAQYAGGSSGYQPRQKQGLLDALSDNQKHSSYHDEKESEITRFQRPNSEMKKMPSKRKIIIKKRSDTADIKPVVEEVSSTVTKTHLQSAEAYIAEVKKCVGIESYKTFSKALLEYKKNGEYSKVAAVMASLFTEDPNHYYLFRKFYRFVRPKDKKQFDQLCKDLTGESCGYKPEDSVSKKRIQTDVLNSTEQPEKRQKVGDNVITTSCQRISENLPHTSSVLQPQYCIKNSQTCNALKSADSGKFVTGNLSNLPFNSDKVSSVINECDKDSNCSNVNSENNGSQKGSSQSENRSQLVQQKLSDSLKNVTGPLDIRCEEKSNSGYLCCKCQNEASVPFKAGCDHICCFKCWRLVFEADKLCPSCQNRVRRRQLIRLCFTGPDVEAGTS